MTHHRAINWALAALIAGGMSTAYLLDGPIDQQDLHTASAASLADAKAQAKRTARGAMEAGRQSKRRTRWRTGLPRASRTGCG